MKNIKTCLQEVSANAPIFTSAYDTCPQLAQAMRRGPDWPSQFIPNWHVPGKRLQKLARRKIHCCCSQRGTRLATRIAITLIEQTASTTVTAMDKVDVSAKETML